MSILARASSKSIYPANIPVYRSDFTLDSLIHAFQAQDAVVSAVATDVVSEQFAIIDAAVKAKVKRYIPSEFGGDSAIDTLEDNAPFAVSKRQIIDYLKMKESEGLSWTGIHVAAFFDYVSGHAMQGLSLRESPSLTFGKSQLHEVGRGVLGWDLKGMKVTIYDSGDQPFEGTTTNQVGLALVSTLQHLGETKNQRVYVNSFTISQNEVLATFESLLEKRFEISHSTTVELVAAAKEHLAQGLWEVAYPEAVTASMYLNSGFGYFSGRPDHWNKVLELPQQTLEDAATDLLKKIGMI